MGDSRFESALEDAEKAHAEGRLTELEAEVVIQALGSLAAGENRLLANALATRLLNQHRRSSTLLEHVADGVVALDDSGRVLFANPAAEKMLGWDRDALHGRDFHDTIRHRKSTGEEVTRQECTILSIMDDETLDAVRVHDHDLFERADGSTFMVGITAAAVVQQRERTGIAVVFRDITEQRAQQRRLALFGPALDAVPMPVFALGRDGYILYVNQAAADHLGYDRDELLGMRVFDIDRDYPPASWDDHWGELKRGGISRFDTHHETRDGRIVPVRVRVQHVEHDGDEFHVAIADPIDHE